MRGECVGFVWGGCKVRGGVWGVRGECLWCVWGLCEVSGMREVCVGCV